jgi:hypothetical protein
MGLSLLDGLGLAQEKTEPMGTGSAEATRIAILKPFLKWVHGV